MLFRIIKRIRKILFRINVKNIKFSWFLNGNSKNKILRILKLNTLNQKRNIWFYGWIKYD